MGEEAAWLTAASAAGPIVTVDFESFALTSTPAFSVPLTSDVTMSTQTSGGGPAAGFHIDDIAPFQGNYNSAGFNTTPGGEKHAVWHTSSPPIQTVRFIFSQPIQAFSMWITGTGSGGIIDRLSHRLDWDGIGPGGFGFNVYGPPFDAYWDNAIFVGFVDPTASSTHVQLDLRFPSYPSGSDGAYSFDDIRWVAAAAVPEPSALALVGLAMGIAAGRRRAPCKRP